MRVATIALLLAANIASAACQETTLNPSDRHVVGQYSLRSISDGKSFILVSTASSDSALGDVGGAVEGIGWSPDLLLVFRSDSTGNKAYYLLDPKEGILAGPEPTVNVALPRGFTFMTAQEAWDSLR